MNGSSIQLPDRNLSRDVQGASVSNRVNFLRSRRTNEVPISRAPGSAIHEPKNPGPTSSHYLRFIFSTEDKCDGTLVRGSSTARSVLYVAHQEQRTRTSFAKQEYRCGITIL